MEWWMIFMSDKTPLTSELRRRFVQAQAGSFCVSRSNVENLARDWRTTGLVCTQRLTNWVVNLGKALTFGYCSVARTGRSMILAALRTLLLLWTTWSKKEIIGLNFSCMSHRKRALVLGTSLPRLLEVAAAMTNPLGPEVGTWGIFSITKNDFLAIFIKLIWLGVGFLNRTGAEIGCYLDKKCKKILFYYWKNSKIPKVPSSVRGLWMAL